METDFTIFVLNNVSDVCRDKVSKVLHMLNLTIEDVKNRKMIIEEAAEISDDRIICFWIRSSIRKILEGAHLREMKKFESNKISRYE